MKKQRGGTFLGFVLGLVLGLAVALGVAIYVTKVPVPFLNKGQSRTPGQDEAEAKKNKDWDPNAPLYGKNQPKPAQPPAAPASEAAPKTETAKADSKPPKSDSKGEVKPAVSADPLGDLVKSKTAAASVAAEPFIYFVQLGAFRTMEDAEAQRAKLSLTGVETKITEREQSGRMVYRVRTGPYDTKDEAERNKEKLEKAGLETALVRVQR